jgi:hypothetical protein
MHRSDASPMYRSLNAGPATPRGSGIKKSVAVL